MSASSPAGATPQDPGAANTLLAASAALLSAAGVAVPASGPSGAAATGAPATDPATSPAVAPTSAGLIASGPAATGPATAGGSSVTGLPVATGRQLSSALGGSPGPAANPGATAPFAPTPLGVSPPLSMSQAGRLLPADAYADPVVSGPAVAAAPAENVPEPGPLALFAVILSTPALRAAWHRISRRHRSPGVRSGGAEPWRS